MIGHSSCSDCAYKDVCKYTVEYTTEVENMIKIQPKEGICDITIKCKYFKSKEPPKPRLGLNARNR